jgi:hypothetical protein
MSWSLRGSYVETCSCELMCPCNLSLGIGTSTPGAFLGEVVKIELGVQLIEPSPPTNS